MDGGWVGVEEPPLHFHHLSQREAGRHFEAAVREEEERRQRQAGWPPAPLALGTYVTWHLTSFGKHFFLPFSFCACDTHTLGIYI